MEYKGGAFYWVKHEDKWKVAQFFNGLNYWLLCDLEVELFEKDIQEVGEIIERNPKYYHVITDATKDELLKECLTLFEHLKEKGDFFISAIEFDGMDYSVDGEKIGREITVLIDKIKGL